MFHSRISSLGHYLPKKVLTNTELEKVVDTSDQWIQRRTGIYSRHIAGPKELPSDMGYHATTIALKQAHLNAKDIDLIIVATLYPDQLMPNTACTLQAKLKVECPALDISAACSGFVYAFTIANQFIQTGTYKNILVVGTEALHHITNYQDRSTCILFGDGAGVCILSQNTKPNKGCVYYQKLHTYGKLGSWLHIPLPGARHPAMDKQTTLRKDHCIQMDGPKVFKKAVEIFCSSYHDAIKESSIHADQIDWIIPHQANERILQQFCKVTGYPTEKVIFDIKHTGNTSAASIPLSFARAVEQKKIKRGQNILMIAVGGGMTSGSLLIRY